MKKFLFFSCAISLVCAGCGDEPKGQEDNPPEIDDSVVTLDASSIKTTSAVLNGLVNSDAIEDDRLNVTKCGFIISTNDNPTKENGKIINGDISSSGTYSACVRNLAPEESYYYVSFFYDGTKYYYGEVLSFTSVKFDSSMLKMEAVAKETSVDLKGFIDYEGIGYMDNFKAGFDIGVAITYSNDLSSVGDNYTFETTIDNISAAKEYECSFFLQYVDINGNEQTLRGEKNTFYTDYDLPTGAVDLGLSVLWSSVNIGASSPEELGDFFAWGEVSPKSEYTPSNYLYANTIIGNDITPSGWQGQSKFYSIIETEYDAATANMGNGWKMPTEEQCDELANECEWEDMTFKGKSGFIVTGKNGNKIFIPECGYYVENEYRKDGARYWTGECRTDKYSDSGKSGAALSAYVSIIGLTKGTDQIFDGYYGMCIRPVKDK